MIIRPDWPAIHSLINDLYEDSVKAGLCSSLSEFLNDMPVKRVDKETGEEVKITLRDFIDE